MAIMKKKSIFIALLGGAMLLSAYQANAVDQEIETTLTGFSTKDSYVSKPVTFVWEEVGFGGDFVVTLEPFNTFQMCEGPLSSTIYRGYFDVDGDILSR